MCVPKIALCVGTAIYSTGFCGILCGCKLSTQWNRASIVVEWWRDFWAYSTPDRNIAQFP